MTTFCDAFGIIPQVQFDALLHAVLTVPDHCWLVLTVTEVVAFTGLQPPDDDTVRVYTCAPLAIGVADRLAVLAGIGKPALPLPVQEYVYDPLPPDAEDVRFTPAPIHIGPLLNAEADILPSTVTDCVCVAAIQPDPE